MPLAATPPWFADNLTMIAVVTLLVLSVLVFRMVQKTALRLTLLGVLAAMALFVYTNRVEFETCARTCECRIANQDITIPACNTATR